MIWILIILVIICCILGIRLFMTNKEISHMTKQINNLSKINTNNLLWTKFETRQISKLVNEINNLLKQNQSDKTKIEVAQKEFKATVTNVSHDLRTPLTSAKGYIQMLMDDNIPDDKKKEYINIIEKKLVYLQKLLQDLFEFAKIESDQYSIDHTTVNLTQIIQDVVLQNYNELSKCSTSPNIEIQDTPAYVIGDQKIIERIFQNLLQNALRHGLGEIHVIQKQEDYGKQKKSVIIIKNTSPPLQQIELEQFFKRFYTSDNSRNSKSSGLGLTITKEFMDKLKGNISLNYSDGWFSVTLTFDQVKYNPIL